MMTSTILVGVVLGLMLVTLPWGQSAPTHRQRHRGAMMSSTDMKDYLMNFGYMKRSTGGHLAMRRALRKFQRMMSLPATGRMNRVTSDKMKQPRCGVPDFGIMKDPKKPLNIYDEEKQAFVWPKRDLTWRVYNYSPDLPIETQRVAFYEALQLWSSVTPLSFQEVSSGDADFKIHFYRYEHGDGYANSFDGPGRVLAHAYYPESGEVHYDDDETWSDSERGTNLKIVATHEFGHALGLPHNMYSREAIMAPFYQYIPNFNKLHTEDIREIQKLYGARPHGPTTTTTTSTTAPSTSTVSPGNGNTVCKVDFEAMFLGKDDHYTVFNGGRMWKLDDGGIVSGYPVSIQDEFEQAPATVSASAYLDRIGSTFLFHGSRVYKYEGSRLVATQHMRNLPYPHTLDAAVVQRDQRVYLIQGSDVFLFDDVSLDISARWSSKLNKIWNNIPNMGQIDSAIRLLDTGSEAYGSVYFFTGEKYYKYDEESRRVDTGFPRNKASDWISSSC